MMFEDPDELVRIELMLLPMYRHWEISQAPHLFMSYIHDQHACVL